MKYHFDARHTPPVCLSVCMAAEDQSPWLWNPHGKDTRNGKFYDKEDRWSGLSHPVSLAAYGNNLAAMPGSSRINVATTYWSPRKEYKWCVYFMCIPANHAYLSIFLHTLTLSYHIWIRLNSFGPGRICTDKIRSPTSPVGHIVGLLCPPSATWEQVDQGKTCRGDLWCVVGLHRHQQLQS